MTSTQPSHSADSSPSHAESFLRVALLLLLSWFLGGMTWQILCEEPMLGQSFFSPASWQWGVENLFGAEFSTSVTGTTIVRASLTRCLIAMAIMLGVWACGLWIVTRRSTKTREFVSRLLTLAIFWLIPGVWGVLWMVALIVQWTGLASLLQATLIFWISLPIAGSMALIFRECCHSDSQKSNRVPTSVWICGAVYLAVFVTMNWGLWFNLRLPHGDSAMYEEHLWNVLHGKGFRSYLDQGLFWGEHIQFVHLFLLPIYSLWPSHLYLELCESLALASGAIPVFWMAQRSSGSRKAAAMLSLTYLLYFPLQFLDISVDLKTFRPIAFGVPIVLFALDLIDRKRYLAGFLALLLSLPCKEDYAIVLFSVGLALLAQATWQKWGEKEKAMDTRPWKYGLALLLIGPVYLIAALRAIRWFRSGVEVHYAGYFTKFGDSTSEIVWNILFNPALLFGELFSISSLVYALALLVPLGFVPLKAPLRLLGCLPMFVLLCLNELAQDPRHHFHAPLVPLMFWTCAAGLATKKKSQDEETENISAESLEEREQGQARKTGLWIVSSAFATSLWFSMSPLGVAFWDTGSRWNGITLYVPDERPAQFVKIADLIPRSARIASTDYVHPRYTHFERSYDYSEYARKVSGYELGVPADTDYIVIDTQHPYSTINTPEQVREYREHPEAWELLPDRTDGYFIVLKRRVD